jgi:cell division septation protein DedD
MAAVGIGLAVLFLGVGVLVGRGGSNNAKTVAAPAPSVVTVGSGSGTSTTAADTGTAFKSDWPAGKDGWTVELQALSKGSNDPAKVAAAKQAATGQGATAVGALDSDEYGSLTPNQYVVYSGNFKSKAEATKALGKLKKSFPKAKVVHVSATGAGPVINSAKSKQDKQKLQQLQNLSGSDYSKQSRKLPKTLQLPGKAPPKDNKQGGGGSGFQTIG